MSDSDRVTSVVTAPPGWRWCAVSIFDDHSIYFELLPIPAFALVVEAERKHAPALIPFVHDRTPGDLCYHECLLLATDDLIDAVNGLGFMVPPTWSDEAIYRDIEAAVDSIRARESRMRK